MSDEQARCGSFRCGTLGSGLERGLLAKGVKFPR
jgi:hypothetical protein